VEQAEVPHRLAELHLGHAQPMRIPRQQAQSRQPSGAARGKAAAAAAAGLGPAVEIKPTTPAPDGRRPLAPGRWSPSGPRPASAVGHKAEAWLCGQLLCPCGLAGGRWCQAHGCQTEQRRRSAQQPAVRVAGVHVSLLQAPAAPTEGASRTQRHPHQAAALRPARWLCYVSSSSVSVFLGTPRRMAPESCCVAPESGQSWDLCLERRCCCTPAASRNMYRLVHGLLCQAPGRDRHMCLLTSWAHGSSCISP